MSLSSALIEAVRLSVSDPSLDVRIADRTSRWVSDVSNVSIRVLGIRRLGIDEPRIRDVGDPSGDLREMIHGVRVVRIQIVVDGDTHDLGFASEDLADRIVAGFERSDVRALLEAENLSAATCGPVLTAPVRGDAGDTRSVAIFDLAFNTSREVRGDLISWIETAPVNSALLARLRPGAGSLFLSGLSPALRAAMVPGIGSLALSGGAPVLAVSDPSTIFPTGNLLWIDGRGGVFLRDAGGSAPSNGEEIAAAINRGRGVGDATKQVGGSIVYNAAAFDGRGAPVFSISTDSKMTVPAWVLAGRVSGGAVYQNATDFATVYQHGEVNEHSALFFGGALNARRSVGGSPTDTSLLTSPGPPRITTFALQQSSGVLWDTYGTATNTASVAMPSGALVTWIGGLNVAAYPLNGPLGEIVLWDGVMSTDQREALQAYFQDRWIGDFVMPAGDSITRGYLTGGAVDGGYRLDLQADFPQQITQIGPYQDNGLFHNGGGGRTIAALNAALNDPPTGIGPSGRFRPRVLIVIIGTNNANDAGYDGDASAADLATLLTTIDTLEPDIRLVIMSSLPALNTAFAANATDFNSRIGAVLDASAIHLAGRMVRVDCLTACPVGLLGADNLHPSAAGYAALAAAVASALATALAL